MCIEHIRFCAFIQLGKTDIIQCKIRYIRPTEYIIYYIHKRGRILKKLGSKQVVAIAIAVAIAHIKCSVPATIHWTRRNDRLKLRKIETAMALALVTLI